ncbi:MAG: hypothetical protein V4580_06495 [Bacteroidota bacterium]
MFLTELKLLVLKGIGTFFVMWTRSCKRQAGTRLSLQSFCKGTQKGFPLASLALVLRIKSQVNCHFE